MSSNKGLLSKLEDTLLRELSSATGAGGCRLKSTGRLLLKARGLKTTEHSNPTTPHHNLQNR